jgi:hypothetical protein
VKDNGSGNVGGVITYNAPGELEKFIGMDSPYEAPENAELRIDTAALSVAQAGAVVRKLAETGVIGPAACVSAARSCALRFGKPGPEHENSFTARGL